MTFTYGVFLFIVITLLYSEHTKGANVESVFIRNGVKFATDLYSAVIEENNSTIGNVVVSPFAVQACGALLYLGAGGETAEDLAQGLRLVPNNTDAVEKSFRNTLKHHNNKFVQILNKIYVGKNATVKKDFLHVITDKFFTEVESVDFTRSEETAEAINYWVRYATNNKVKGFFTADDFDAKTNALMTFVNTIYFKALWKVPFDYARKLKFWTSENEAKEVDMMSQLDLFKYGEIEELDSKVVELEYNNTDIAMLIILPNKRTGLQDLERKLSQVDLIELSDKLDYSDVEVLLPKFRIEFSADLKTVFTKMGMGLLFNDPDLSNMLEGENIKVDKAKHSSFIEVTELGTEAGSATTFSFHFLSKPELFVADHPFIFTIVSKSAVLFVGRYVN